MILPLPGFPPAKYPWLNGLEAMVPPTCWALGSCTTAGPLPNSCCVAPEYIECCNQNNARNYEGYSLHSDSKEKAPRQDHVDATMIQSMCVAKAVDIRKLGEGSANFNVSCTRRRPSLFNRLCSTKNSFSNASSECDRDKRGTDTRRDHSRRLLF